jgi:hypothetical protein
VTSPEYVKHPITQRVVESKVATKVVKPVAHKVVEKTPEPVKHAAHATADVTKKVMTKPVYTEDELIADELDKQDANDIHLDASNILAIIGIWTGVVLIIGFLLITGGGAGH